MWLLEHHFISKAWQAILNWPSWWTDLAKHITAVILKAFYCSRGTSLGTQKALQRTLELFVMLRKTLTPINQVFMWLSTQAFKWMKFMDHLFFLPINGGQRVNHQIEIPVILNFLFLPFGNHQTLRCMNSLLKIRYIEEYVLNFPLLFLYRTEAS